MGERGEGVPYTTKEDKEEKRLEVKRQRKFFRGVPEI